MSFKQFIESTIKQYWDPGKLPPILYTATWKAWVPSIQKVGLLTSPPTRNFDWSEQGIYLSNDLEFCVSAVEATENKEIPSEWFDSENIAVLEIDSKKLDKSKLIKDPHMLDAPESRRSYFYQTNIPADAIIGITYH